jgi:hypothetical protein
MVSEANRKTEPILTPNPNRFVICECPISDVLASFSIYKHSCSCSSNSLLFPSPFLPPSNLSTFLLVPIKYQSVSYYFLFYYFHFTLECLIAVEGFFQRLLTYPLFIKPSFFLTPSLYPLSIFPLIGLGNVQEGRSFFLDSRGARFSL